MARAQFLRTRHCGTNETAAQDSIWYFHGWEVERTGLPKREMCSHRSNHWSVLGMKFH